MKTKKEQEFMNEMQDKYIRFDWAIKRLLRQKANFDVLEGFLTVFIGERITIVAAGERGQPTVCGRQVHHVPRRASRLR